VSQEFNEILPHPPKNKLVRDLKEKLKRKEFRVEGQVLVWNLYPHHTK
jgi:hypothetical protein